MKNTKCNSYKCRNCGYKFKEDKDNYRTLVTVGDVLSHTINNVEGSEEFESMNHKEEFLKKIYSRVQDLSMVVFTCGKYGISKGDLENYALLDESRSTLFTCGLCGGGTLERV